MQRDLAGSCVVFWIHVCVPALQDGLDSLDFILGPASSRWGGVRHAQGRQQPWKLRYVGVGNEDCGRPHYRHHYTVFAAALRRLAGGGGHVSEGGDLATTYAIAPSAGTTLRSNFYAPTAGTTLRSNCYAPTAGITLRSNCYATATLARAWMQTCGESARMRCTMMQVVSQGGGSRQVGHQQCGHGPGVTDCLITGCLSLLSPTHLRCPPTHREFHTYRPPAATWTTLRQAVDEYGYVTACVWGVEGLSRHTAPDVCDLCACVHVHVCGKGVWSHLLKCAFMLCVCVYAAAPSLTWQSVTRRHAGGCH